MSILIVVKLFLYNEETSTEVIVRLGYGSIIGTDEGERIQIDDRLYLPIQIGSKISAEQYGQVIRSEQDVGNITFALDEEIWPYLDYHWVGRKVEIWKGNLGDEFQDFELVYSGLISDLSFEGSALIDVDVHEISPPDK